VPSSGEKKNEEGAEKTTKDSFKESARTRIEPYLSTISFPTV
jgi:hypothetical protein